MSLPSSQALHNRLLVKIDLLGGRLRSRIFVGPVLLGAQIGGVPPGAVLPVLPGGVSSTGVLPGGAPAPSGGVSSSGVLSGAAPTDLGVDPSASAPVSVLAAKIRSLSDAFTAALFDREKKDLLDRLVHVKGSRSGLDVVVEADPAISSLPFELLRVRPNQFLVDTPNVRFYRRVGEAGRSATPPRPGRLSILVLSPVDDTLIGQSALSTMYADARATGDVDVTIVDLGHERSFIDALRRKPFHVVHVFVASASAASESPTMAGKGAEAGSLAGAGPEPETATAPGNALVDGKGIETTTTGARDDAGVQVGKAAHGRTGTQDRTSAQGGTGTQDRTSAQGGTGTQDRTSAQGGTGTQDRTAAQGGLRAQGGTGAHEHTSAQGGLRTQDGGRAAAQSGTAAGGTAAHVSTSAHVSTAARDRMRAPDGTTAQDRTAAQGGMRAQGGAAVPDGTGNGSRDGILARAPSGVRWMSAERLAALLADAVAAVPLVVVSGGRSRPDGLARELVRHGVDRVVATQDTLTGPHASSSMFSVRAFYAALAADPALTVAGALAQARQAFVARHPDIEDSRHGMPIVRSYWTTVHTLFAAADDPPLRGSAGG